jgi:hypothetical protein
MELVGTELSKLIPEWAVSNSSKCRCKDFARKMDRWGADGCFARREQIVFHLMKQGEHLIPAFKLVPDVVRKAIAVRLLKKAIANAKAVQ